ncbi:hypothetical protein LshimejAT787_2300580 [Lyophyllum shimeji]|uniref:BTB domain-containing protein n=1 Tax=Lyophyllum shimeji TaxID=47721 RepID=A0A9P3Q1P7_LYOSH|nr:hypothetical protein LshimejAT787_2300580 [Lyophyllum shimeji]
MATLATLISQRRAVPDDARGSPYFYDGNILLVTHDAAFKSYRGLLISKANWFASTVAGMNDDSVDVVENCPIIPMEDSSQDLSYFLEALLDETGSHFPFESLSDFYALAGALRLATKYGAEEVRTNAIATLERRYPTTLSGWDRIRSYSAGCAPWECDRVLIINLAREVEAFSILPSAMAMLTNDSSAGEVFGVPLHPFTPRRTLSPHSRLNPDDERGFALMKEFNHVSIVLMLKFIRSVGAGCKRPPERTPANAGRAPVGASTLRPRASQCKQTFKEIAAGLLELLVLENPVGYADFVGSVDRVMQDRERVCRVCWQDFRAGYVKRRQSWWEEVPRVLGFSGWGDDRLQPVEG